jgi:hypothetical protein
VCGSGPGEREKRVNGLHYSTSRGEDEERGKERLS